MKPELRFCFLAWMVWDLLGSAGTGGAAEPALGPLKPPAEAVRWLEQQKGKVSPRDADLLRRAQETLYANILDGQWRPLRGISPSPFRYRGVWNWDAAFHALALCRWDTPLAREQIRIFLDHQLPSGGFIDVIWEKRGWWTPSANRRCFPGFAPSWTAGNPTSATSNWPIRNSSPTPVFGSASAGEPARGSFTTAAALQISRRAGTTRSVGTRAVKTFGRLI